MLDTILAIKRQEIQTILLPDQQEAEHHSLNDALKNASHKAGLIAEVKKASPSKGIIRDDFNPVVIANAYEKAGAAAISVLTDQHFFQGHRDFLTDIKKVVSLPVLRKDFIIDHLQVEESARIGADAILLIGEVLEPKQLHEFYRHAEELGLEALVEVHAEKTLEGILKEFTPKIIGINNRNLETFETKLSQTKEISSLVPEESLLVSESGIFTYEDIEEVVNAGAEGILVGEALMRQGNIGEAVKRLMGGVPL
ncbi:indole-3-glycerol phosphate synthase TrpC [Thalassobacillus pellis]|uniref:indole-3-glycerol phosphate synthase TrpC n=1 Tax=Thalassobacillus pellis TaxID=748008 RepID=UPI001960D42E|nr:indole-3-glycerol phosphate synthase TrpC [Thalassobacillus pellis]MBM7553756.1 indole-3-glycerol phosphate synthase [Thalassobacillus pellis]